MSELSLLTLYRAIILQRKPVLWNFIGNHQLFYKEQSYVFMVTFIATYKNLAKLKNNIY